MIPDRAVEVEIEHDAWLAALPQATSMVMRSATATLATVDRAIAGIVILLTSDAEVADLNQRFRGKPGPTNVLSFPAADQVGGHLGDIALAYGVCAREAGEQGKTLAHHLQHLVAHGVLHLLGYDHETDAEAHEMEGLERKILAGLGIADPYAAEQGDHG